MKTTLTLLCHHHQQAVRAPEVRGKGKEGKGGGELVMAT